MNSLLYNILKIIKFVITIVNVDNNNNKIDDAEDDNDDLLIFYTVQSIQSIILLLLLSLTCCCTALMYECMHICLLRKMRFINLQTAAINWASLYLWRHIMAYVLRD